MSGEVSVIIPTLNEAERVGAAIDSAFAAGAAEVLVSDGGSSDATVEVARMRGATVLTGERSRAAQLNAGAAAARSANIVFLHADTLLPERACEAIARALATKPFGGFLLAFAEHSLRLRWTAFAINVRTKITRAPWGDQAQFARRADFLRGGGYPPVPIMEDYALAMRMRRSGSVAVLPLRVVTSGRRFLARGLLRTTITNWKVIIAWHLGVTPEKLARWYRG